MAIIKKYNKENKTTYVYESTSYWVPELGQPRSKRKLIGKIDPETGEIIPTAGRGRKPKKQEVSNDTATTVKGTAALSGGAAVKLSEDDDLRTLYETCKQQLREMEAALTKAESRIAEFTKEKQETTKQLELILRQLRN